MQAFFLPAGTGQRFCIHHPPAGNATRGAVLYLHPWAEEMNKSRRMAAMQSRALAQAGFAVLQIDLHGCGDSSGDFGDASWEDWIADTLLGVRWLREHHPSAPLWLWGLRAGALLAAQAAAQLDEACNFLFWQPTPAGKPLLQQFLRLKLAGDLQQGPPKGAMDALRQELAAGRSVDVAGYALPAALAHGLERATLAPPARTGGTVAWIEVSSREGATLLPASASTVAAWTAAGHAMQTSVVPGPPFWQTQEIEDAPALLLASVAAMQAVPALAVAA
jgi:exosortase A-associated hydrolase 2